MKSRKSPQQTRRSRHASPRGPVRRGSAAILGVLLTSAMVVILAMTLDLQKIHNGEAELGRSADAAAMAACWELFDAQVDKADPGQWSGRVSGEAEKFVRPNEVGGDALSLGDSDVVLGRYDLQTKEFVADQTDQANAVRVSVHRQNSMNGELPLFFGGLLGRNSQPMTQVSTAALLKNISGFETPGEDGRCIDMLPFALDLDTWNDVIAGNGPDDFGFVDGVLRRGNGICECNLYPQGTGSPGNRGTVDIGGANNSTNDIKRQIVSGISAEDMRQLGKPLAFDQSGRLQLGGDTGISAGVKAALASIIGQKRMIPIFESVSGNGNNARYEIVKFAGVRILDVNLTGRMKSKRLIVEPAPVVARGVKFDRSATSRTDFIYSPVMLVN